MTDFAVPQAQGDATSPPNFLGDVQVEVGKAPRPLVGAMDEGVLWQAAPGQFWLHIPEVATFLVRGGRTITIDPEPGAETTEVSRFLHATPLAALRYQQGSLVFHAAAAADSRGAILLAGESGCGKSTLLTVLLRRGWKMLADEVSPLDWDGRGLVCVLPTFPQVRLWRDAGERLGVDPKVSDYKGESWHVAVPTNQFSATAQALRAIYWLRTHNVDAIECRELQGMDRFRAVGTLAYHSHIANALLDRVAYMRQASAISQTVPVRRLCRPRGSARVKWSVEELADHVEADCA